MRWHLPRSLWLPFLYGTVVDRRVIGERGVRDVGDEVAVLINAHAVLANHFADGHCIESPFFKDAEDFLLAPFLGHQQHALLRFAEHDLVCGHAGLALRYAVKFNLKSYTAARPHLAG